ncbi:mechanosensitive ion channel family protein [Flavobacterium sp. '19STA2R22 D10 B1']|uniref:mechanosensitive ion channel family protein n=1 Tax=Flavobacterium aerium TaxID=3037261 RepID=UPI00278C06E1|nr:mechanosensitive ion channel domain-containing protein [Flavobacterium sp. '19STA2R22 D10 B1']
MENDIIDLFKDIISFKVIDTKNVDLTFGIIITVILVFIFTSYILKIIRKIITKNLPVTDKNKFISIFQFVKYIVYITVIMFTLNASGININVFLTASAAIFVGLGFALQQLFQDIISGILIILDQSLHVGDIIEVDGKVSRVTEIKLRSTRAVTRNDRVMIIPNHKFMNDVLFNWTQNSSVIRESVEIGVAYGSDVDLVKKLLIDAALAQDAVLKTPEPIVNFENFGDSSLDFAVYFFLPDGFVAQRIKSDIRFEINKQFNDNKISIPFPQRDVYLYNKNQE